MDGGKLQLKDLVPEKLGLLACLLAIYVGLTAADVITTNAVLSTGMGREANPLVRWLMGVLGASWWLPKVFMALVLSLLCYKAWDRSPVAKSMTLLYSIIYFHIASHNWALVRVADEVRRYCG